MPSGCAAAPSCSTAGTTPAVTSQTGDGKASLSRGDSKRPNLGPSPVQGQTRPLDYKCASSRRSRTAGAVVGSSQVADGYVVNARLPRTARSADACDIRVTPAAGLPSAGMQLRGHPLDPVVLAAGALHRHRGVGAANTSPAARLSRPNAAGRVEYRFNSPRVSCSRNSRKDSLLRTPVSAKARALNAGQPERAAGMTLVCRSCGAVVSSAPSEASPSEP